MSLSDPDRKVMKTYGTKRVAKVADYPVKVLEALQG